MGNKKLTYFFCTFRTESCKKKEGKQSGKMAGKATHSCRQRGEFTRAAREGPHYDIKQDLISESDLMR